MNKEQVGRAIAAGAGVLAVEALIWGSAYLELKPEDLWLFVIGMFYSGHCLFWGAPQIAGIAAGVGAYELGTRTVRAARALIKKPKC